MPGKKTVAKRDARIDAHIAKAPPFAKPILTYLRAVVHEACPEVEETVKWSHPHFLYKGLLCGMSAFKEHCAFGFWKGQQIIAQSDHKNSDAMGQFGRITSLQDLPSKKQIVAYVQLAMKLNEVGTKAPVKRTPRKPIPPPADLLAAMKRNQKAQSTFKNFNPSNQREYVTWVIEAKTDATRTRRLTTAIEFLAEGKTRNWKYETKK